MSEKENNESKSSAFQKTQPVSKSKESNNNKKSLLLIPIFVILIISGSFFIYKQNNKSKTSMVCDSITANISQNTASLTVDKRAELEGLVKEIESKENYQSDANCLVPVVAFYIYKADLEKANTNFNILEGLSSSQKLSDAYSAYPNILRDFKVELEGLRLRTEQIKSNTIYFSE